MRKDTKNKIFTLFVLAMFLGSTVAFALMFVLPTNNEQEVKFVYDAPLPEDKEAVFLNSNIVIIEEFFSPTCPHCRAMKPILDEIVSEFNGNVVLEKVDVNKYQIETRRYNVDGVPTFILKGKTMDRVVGEVPKETLVKRICALFTTPIDKCSAY